MRDLEKDLSLCQSAAQGLPEPMHPLTKHFVTSAIGGWPEAIRRAMEAEAQKQELEAQCAVMRDALNTISDLVSCLPNYLQSNPEITYELEKADKALASDAGCDLLERLRKLEVVVEAAKTLIENTGVWPIEMLGRVDKLQIALMALKDGGQA